MGMASREERRIIPFL